MALSDTLSTPTGGQKKGGKIKPQNGENFGTETGIIFRTSIEWSGVSFKFFKPYKYSASE